MGIAAYVVPFVFVFQPGLIFEGSGADIAIAAIKTTIGVALLAVGMAGYMFRSMSIVEQVLIGLCGIIIMVIPLGMGISWPMIGGAAIVTIGLTALQLKARSQPAGEAG